MVALRRWLLMAIGLLLSGALAAPVVAQLPPLELFQPPAAPTTPAPQPIPAPAVANQAPAPAAPPAAQPAQPPNNVQFASLDTVKAELGQSWEEIWEAIVKVGRIKIIEGAKED